jgi:hypothetical protein
MFILSIQTLNSWLQKGRTTRILEMSSERLKKIRIVTVLIIVKIPTGRYPSLITKSPNFTEIPHGPKASNEPRSTKLNVIVLDRARRAIAPAKT